MSFIKSKLFLAIIIIVVSLLVVLFVRNNVPDSAPQQNIAVGEPNPSGNQDQNSNFITKAELSNHNTKADCWISYNGKVYDLTSFLPNHPGTAGRILPFCGTSDEFKAAFERQHGTSQVKALMKFGTFMGDFQIVGTSN